MIDFRRFSFLLEAGRASFASASREQPFRLLTRRDTHFILASRLARQPPRHLLRPNDDGSC